MNPDPILAEIRQYRDAHAAKFGYDVRKMAEDIRSREGRDGRKVVNRERHPATVRPPEPTPPTPKAA